jgi:hypothetical protein
MKTPLHRFLGFLLLFLLSPKAIAQVMPFGIFHTAQAAQIVGKDNTTLVVEVTTATGRLWMDRNLGATRAAIIITDAEAQGHYYQWGRGADGHQIKTSGTTPGPINSDTPGSLFISTTTSDWRSHKNDALWQGENGTNNPCPSGFRIPTQPEWQAEIDGFIANGQTPFSSLLKLPYAGFRNRNGTTSISNQNDRCFYWSSTIINDNSYNFYFTSSTIQSNMSNLRSYGFPIRCIKN